MPVAADEYRIYITVVNETDEFQNLMVFQQEDQLGLMFDKLFPLAWQVFPLPGREEGIERKGTTEYPDSQQIGVTREMDSAAKMSREISSEENAHDERLPLFAERGIDGPLTEGLVRKNDVKKMRESGAFLLKHIYETTDSSLLPEAMFNGSLTIVADAVNGEAFRYVIDDKGGQHLTRLSEKSEDGSIICENGGRLLIAVDYYKNGSRIAVWPDLADGDKARFLLKRKLFFSYGENLRNGEIIKTKLEGEHVESADLGGCSRIQARLTYDPGLPGKKKKWIIEKN